MPSYPAFNDLSSFTAPQQGEMQQFISYTSGYLSAQHKADGSHGDVTADSLTVASGVINATTGAKSTGNITSTGGTLTMTGTGQSRLGGNLRVNQAGATTATTDEPVDIGLEGTIGGADGAIGPGMSIRLGSGVGGTARQWDTVLFDNGPTNERYLRLIDVDQGYTPFEVGSANIGGTYWVAPGPNTPAVKTVDLGTTHYGFGKSRWNNCYLNASVFEQNRTTALGFWTAVAFAAGNFTGSGTITWTVTAGEQLQYAYTLIGKTMIVRFAISGSTLAGAGSEARIAIPGGFTAATRTDTIIRAINNGVSTAAVCFIAAGDTIIRCFADMTGTTNWTASASTGVLGEIAFEVS